MYLFKTQTKQCLSVIFFPGRRGGEKDSSYVDRLRFVSEVGLDAASCIFAISVRQTVYWV